MTPYPSVNAPYKCVAPELVDTNIHYTLSISPCDEWQYYNAVNAEQRYANFFKHASHFILNVMLPVCDVEVFIETSEAGRLHMHGIIKIKDIFTFFLMVIPKLRSYGTYEIDTIKDSSQWDIYKHKCKHVIEPHPRRISTQLLKEKSVTIFHTNTIIEPIQTKSKGRPKSKLSVDFS